MATLRSISLHGPLHIPFEVIVVLNQPIVHEESHLDDLVNGVRFIPSAANLGLAGAANRGRNVARGELLIVLHDDAEVESGWMEALVDTADAHPTAGAIGGKVLYPDGRLQNAGMILWRDATSSPPWFGERPPPSAFDRMRVVDYCGTSSLLVRADVWDDIGGLDERFYPVYYVDVDLAMAIRQRGLVVLYQPQSRILHHSGASGSSRWRSFVGARNRQLFIDKWGSALDQYEPGGADVAGAIGRAMTRAASIAPTPHRGDRLLLPSPVFKVPGGPRCTLADGVYLDKERDLRQAYVAYLDETVEQLERQLEVAMVSAARAEQELATLRAASAYLAGTRLSFASDGNAYRYQCIGGYGAEEWGVWLGADALTIVLPHPTTLSTDSSDGWTLQLDALPFLTERRTRSAMTVTVNETIVLHVDETRSGPQRYETRIPARSGSPTNVLVVTIGGGEATSPSSIDLNGDDRPLSVGIIALTLVPAGIVAPSSADDAKPYRPSATRV